MFKTFTLGRSSSCDLAFEHESVSRVHAEVTLTERGRLYLVDRGSAWGSFVWRSEEWQPLKQGYVEEDEHIALGKHKIAVRKLKQKVDSLADVKLINDHFEPLSVKPKRNALTGEIERG